MSFGAGHVQDMFNWMKQNRSQRSSSHSKFKEGNRKINSADAVEEKPNLLQYQKKLYMS